MYKCFCCGCDYDDRIPKFCNECGAFTQEPQDEIDSVESVASYRALLEEHYFGSQSELDIKYRVKLKISRGTHESILAHFKSQKKALDSLGKFSVEFDENVVEAYAGNDTYLKFRFTNNSDEMLRVKFFWDDPETEDDFDLKIESKSFVKPGSSVVIGGSHVFSRIGIKEISDLYITVLDPFQQVKFRSSPLVFKVGNPDQKITQHFTTNNQISIEGRGVVDASGMGSDKNSPMLQSSNEPKWVMLDLTFIPKDQPTTNPSSSVSSQSQAISSNVKDSGSAESGKSADFDENDIRSIEAAANANNLAALNALGRAYYIGEGVAQDFPQAFENFMKAATQGYAPSQNNVGQIYEFGNGVPVNTAKAFEWYSKAAIQKHKVGLFNAGRCFLNGIGVPQNEAKAKELLEESVSAGYVSANALLGDLYANGMAVIKDVRLAADYYLKAALDGDDYGQLRLGNLYQEGDGVPADINLAIKWFTESANKGNPVAQYELAKLYFTSETHSNEKLCAQFAMQAADSGYAPAQALLGNLYRFGSGLPQNFDLARTWLEKAAASGLQEAITDLDDLDSVVFNESHVDCDCPAIDEALIYLDSFLNTFDAHAYGEEETKKNYHRDYEVSNELESVIFSVIEQNTGWPSHQFHGLMIEDISSITTNSDGLIINFDGYANVIYKSGVATISVQNNSLDFNESFDWHEKNADEFSFWISDGNVFLGNVTQNFYRWGGNWFIGDDLASSLQENVNNANSWVSRIFAVAKGEVDSQQILYPEEVKSFESDEQSSEGAVQLADGSTWYGELDSQGLLSGYGTWIWPNGDRYDGYCSHGYLNGQGTYAWANGEFYEGTWFNGLQHGHGVIIRPDGTRIEGNWNQGNLVGQSQKEGLVSSFVKGFKSAYENASK